MFLLRYSMFIKLNMYYYYYNSLQYFNVKKKKKKLATIKTGKHSPKPVYNHVPVFYFTVGMFVEVWAMLELCHTY